MIKDVKKNSIILLTITVIILYFLLKDDFSNIFTALVNSNIAVILFCLLLTIGYYSFKCLSIFLIIKNNNSTISFKKALQQTIIVQFFNGVTPFATGGQPMHIYMLSKEKIETSKATSSVLMDFLSYQVAIILYCFVTLLIDYLLNIFSGNMLARKLVFLGFAINLFVCLVASLVCFSSKVTSYIVKLISKIIRNKEKTEKLKVKVLEFHAGTKIFIKNKPLFIKCILLNIVGLTFYYLVPFFVSYAVTGNFGVSVLNSIVSSSYVFLVGAFVPIPGGSVGVEYGFTQFFGKYFAQSELLAILLLWRFITYYFGIILGGILLSFYKRGESK